MIIIIFINIIKLYFNSIITEQICLEKNNYVFSAFISKKVYLFKC